MGEDYISGFIRQIDGEKDPRCLLLVFAMVPVRTTVCSFVSPAVVYTQICCMSLCAT